ALVQDDPAHQLDVEDALVGLALARFPDRGERLEEELLECLAVLEPLAELGGLRAELLVAERLELGLERGDVVGLLGQPLEAAAFAQPQDLLEVAELLGDPSDSVPTPRRPTRTSQPSPSRPP